MAKYLTLQQVSTSLEHLRSVNPFFGTSFLAFKRIQLPVGRTIEVVFSQVVDDVLVRHYRPSSDYKGFYTPFTTSKQEERWVNPRWSSTTLQRVTVNTFAEAFIHPRGSSIWGWQETYLAKIKDKLKNNSKIPALSLATWLFREQPWPDHTTLEDIREHLYQYYHITPDEKAALFDDSIATDATCELGNQPIHEQQLLEKLGKPPGSAPDEGVTLHQLTITKVGLATRFNYEPKERLNLITGDNSLGKTFLLDCIWRALTGSWAEGMPLLPMAEAESDEPRIHAKIGFKNRAPYTSEYTYNWEQATWNSHTHRKAWPGVVIYARHDGSFAVWDPARHQRNAGHGRSLDEGENGRVFLRSEDVWSGLQREGIDGKMVGVCNGLIQDWFAWQRGGPYHARTWRSLEASIRELSPSPSEKIAAGRGRRLPFDSREFPTLIMPYGELPIIHASAAVKRMLSLAYMLVWAWHEHERNSQLSRREPQPSLILLVDEIEAHLHPRWQRVIIRALMNAVSELATGVSPQLHLSTHSPLVLASVEKIFDEDRDSLYHLRLEESGRVELERLDFVRQGRIDRWLTSDVIGLPASRAIEAEEAIQHANNLQIQHEPPTPEAVREAHEALRQVLADDDEYWFRWRYFANQFGIDA